MKILILNSDSPNNRGDRAILQGNLKLIRESWPNAEIWALSERSERDEKWYGINFLPYSAYTANPLNLIRIAFFSQRCAYVFWGGGEILKDYTNRLGIVYWLLRMLLVRLFNANIYGAFQGIGPTAASSSKRMIVWAVGLTKVFFTRDDESRQKLRQWGARSKIVSSFDPAILNVPEHLDSATEELIRDCYDISQDFLSNAVGVGLRRWFHYTKGGLVPYRLRFWRRRGSKGNDSELETYTRNTAVLLDRIIANHGVNIVFFPMFNARSEGDDKFSRSVMSLMQHSDCTRIIDQENLSPQQYQNIVGRCRIFIATRLHSSIIATSSYVPALAFYYVDKGRLYFEQIGMKKFSRPIEDLLCLHNLKKIERQVAELLENERAVKAQLHKNLDAMRNRVADDFSIIAGRT